MSRTMFILSACLCVLTAGDVRGADPTLPADFPALSTHLYDSKAVGAGYVYLAVASEIEGIGFHLMIVRNDGTVVWYEELPDGCAYDFKLQPNGLPTYAQLVGRHSDAEGGNAIHQVMDQSFARIDSFQMGNGYVAEAQDFQWLPNGHALLFGYYLTPVDLSALVPGGSPEALVSGAVIQELDADRNVVFQWRTWDHYRFDRHSWGAADTGRLVGAFALNTLGLDGDGNMLVATSEWVKKISRQTGDILWHLGGAENEFTFVGVDPSEAIDHIGGHAFQRLNNGNVLIYDNGRRDGSRSAQVHEYALDEQNKTAELVWTYIPDPGVYGSQGGNAQRLSNGNTFIGWGDDGDHAGPACTEVAPDGRKVFELSFEDPRVTSYRAFRFPLPKDITGTNIIKQFVGPGDHRFRSGQIDTGVTINIRTYTGTGYNALGVGRIPLAPLYPTFAGRAPVVLPVRVLVGASGIITIEGRLSFNAKSFNLSDGDTWTIYYRDPMESGPFMPLPTSYSSTSGLLSADLTAFGEFIFGRPDLAPVMLPPILAAPAPEGVVNQTLPVAFDWTARGFVNSYHLQVATDPEFSQLVVDEPEIRETPYIWEAAEAETTYYWRVRTTNDAGPSEWSQASFAAR